MRDLAGICTVLDWIAFQAKLQTFCLQSSPLFFLCTSTERPVFSMGDPGMANSLVAAALSSYPTGKVVAVGYKKNLDGKC